MTPDSTAAAGLPAPLCLEPRPPHIFVVTAADGLQYALEMFVLPAAAIETGVGEFAIELTVKHTVAPSCSCTPDPLPSALAEGSPFDILGSDGRRYCYEVSYRLMSTTTSSPPADGTPTFDVRLELTWKQTSGVRDPVPPIHCWYCGQAHPAKSVSEEHIIPQALSNRSHVLKSVCQRLNGYMAHAFEKRAISSRAMSELQLLAQPPAKDVHRGKVRTASGAEYDRFATPAGEWLLRTLPTETTTRSFSLPVDMPDGQTAHYEIKLPFDLRTGVTGSTELLKARERRTRRDRAALEEHLTRLIADPNRDVGLNDFLQETGGKLRPRPLTILESAVITKTETPSDVLNENLTLDDETFARFFIKIAWTHSVRQFGQRAATNPRAVELLAFLMRAHVPDRYLVERYPQLVTDPVDIGGQPYVFWRHSIPKGRAVAEAICTDEADRRGLERHFARRSRDVEWVGRILRFEIPVRVTLPDADERERMRSHTLSLSNFTTTDGTSTLCRIALFGGRVDVSVLVADVPLAAEYPEPLRIEFPMGSGKT